MQDNDKIYSISDYESIACELKHKGYVFRGLSNRDYKQVPTILFDRYVKDGNNFIIEKEAYYHDKLLEISKENNIDFFSLYEIARHYGFNSRMTDYTSNPYIALYFACKDMPETDAKIICFDYTKYNQKYSLTKKEKNRFTNRMLEKIIYDLINYDYVGGDYYDEDGLYIDDYEFGFPFFINPVIRDSRMNNQNGLFLLWPNLVEVERTLEELDSFCKTIIIDAGSKGLILDELKSQGYCCKDIEKIDSSYINESVIRRIENLTKKQESEL